ncbi:S-adenosyl-L-methionine-dependent methyltransferase [Glarea lozoyensis ATCC 20868]|uniref:S-adenosyl-L-methionine-dependent methyltransferase n=1 Tax=Glarea lozoyensis (strain ATCC 20868 / MF5171) TaxID=1116229 RepID=S3D2N6_GLAL2|nr:S-adenosyl-L-methionine-dependent methyltransferase [Glarea lozoyensis ATCC 20868]EPE26281.1 S-adenosyl-L-methionine-dependent methyltransferase [Glarea lozoyensis ATCC 20868]
MATPRIIHLAQTISASVAKIQDVLTAQGLQTPSFDEDASHYLPLEVLEAQNAVLDATSELNDLLMEPMSMIHCLGGHNNSLCSQAITRFRIASLIPPGGTKSFAEIASQTPLSEQMVTRILRQAMSMRIFCEPEPGMVGHTKASRILVDPVTNDWLGAGTEELWPAATKVVDALEKWPGSEEPSETGFCLANNTTDSIYAFLGANPTRAARFGNAMVAYSKKPEFSPAYLTDHFDWSSLGAATVVHLGGGTGFYAMELAKKFADLKVVVQDMAFMMGPAEAGVPEELKGRVTFEAHDFFAPQIVNADVVFFRWVLRTWGDKYCIAALKAQLPMLKSGARVVVQDMILPEPGKGPFWKERAARSADMSLTAGFNSRDRTVDDWKTLFTAADEGFVLKSVAEPKGSALGILEFVWESKK